MTEQELLDISWELEVAKGCMKIQKQAINYLNGLIDRQQKLIDSMINEREILMKAAIGDFE